VADQAVAAPASVGWTPRAVYELERATVEHRLFEHEYAGLIEASVRRAVQDGEPVVSSAILADTLRLWLATRPEDDPGVTRPVLSMPRAPKPAGPDHQDGAEAEAGAIAAGDDRRTI
jgi:hypothetical protein